MALLLVLGSTLASLWLSPSISVAMSALAVAGFNWFFVDPRYSFHVQFEQDMLLLLTLLGTSSLLSLITSRLRQYLQQHIEQTWQSHWQQRLSADLQRAEDIDGQLRSAVDLLETWTHLPVCIWLEGEAPDSQHLLYRAWLASQQEPGAIGAGTGRYSELQALVMPLRAGVLRIGTLALGPCKEKAVWLRWPVDRLQPLARLLADEVHRLQANVQNRKAQEHMQAQQLRNTLLTAISHDYRTPLATITGAASDLLDSTDLQQAHKAAHVILREAEHLNRMTTNTLQMARLDTSDAHLHTSWESVEELCGVTLAAARRRHPGRLLESEVPLGLPLLRCDPVLVVQLLDNLVENALRYSSASAPVTLRASALHGRIQIQVLDRGIGIPASWRERVFDPFHRVLPDDRSDTGFVDATRRGMGLGLALCRAIARLHDAQLWIEAREGGGTIVVLLFAQQDPPYKAPETTLPGKSS